MRVELDSKHIVQGICKYVILHGLLEDDAAHSYRLERVDSRQDDGTRLAVTLGVGCFAFHFEGEEFRFERAVVGQPVSGKSCDRDTVVHELVSLVGPNVKAVQRLCNLAVEEQDADVEDYFQTFTWNAPNEYWQRASFSPTRSFDSIILDAKVFQELKADLDDFNAEETREWYRKHGIPFRRGYLLHGPPGTGKTSLVAAMATYLRRRVHKVSLVAPRLSDDSLHCAINNVHAPAIVVMEDIDSLFSKHREKKDDFFVTFSGLLNAIDGVGDCSKGVVFVFTTNHPERLDPALVRKGRVDRKFLIGRCSRSMCERMFLRFYPDHPTEAGRFADSVATSSMPQPAAVDIQHHFIKHRLSDASVASVFEADPTEGSAVETSVMWG